MKRPEEFSTKCLLDLFDAGNITVEQLNELVRRQRKELEAAQEQEQEPAHWSESKHTVGKLKVGKTLGGQPTIEALNDNRFCVSIIEHRGPVSYADAERLVACWNHCEGVSTERLIHGEKLYASLFPERQSPAVAVPDEDRFLQALGRVMCSECSDDGPCCMPDIRDLRRIISIKSPRITEQDALYANKLQANAVMGLIYTLIGAYDSGSISTPMLSIATLYQVARDHIKDEFGVEFKSMVAEYGEDFVKHCHSVRPPLPAGWRLGAGADGRIILEDKNGIAVNIHKSAVMSGLTHPWGHVEEFFNDLLAVPEVTHA